MNQKGIPMAPDQTGTATLTEDQVLDRIRATLAEQKVPGAETASMEATWSELDVDSLDLVELVKALEDRFEITISDDDLKPIESVGDAISLTLRLSEAEEGAPA
jgi:acyl carrier protein